MPKKDTPKVMIYLYKINVGLAKIEELLVLLFSSALIFVIGVAVVSRYLLYIPTPWADEAARYITIAMVYFGIGYCLFYKEHISINFIDTVLASIFKNPEKVFSILLRITNLIIVIFFVYFLNNYFGFFLKVISYGQKSPAMHVPMEIPMSTGIIGMSFTIFHAVSLLVLPDSILEGEKK